MKHQLRYLTALAFMISTIVAGAGEAVPKDLFGPAVALGDASGKELVSRQAQGCPALADFNGDGKPDLILGSKTGMDSANGTIWLIPNKGTAAKPAFAWDDAFQVTDAGRNLSIGCG